MGLDSFMGAKKSSKKTKKKSSEKKTKKKSSLKKTSNSKSKPVSEIEMSEIENEEVVEPELEENVENVAANSSKFTLVTVKLACDSKCGYKKTLKRPKSFVPKERDLKCPRCGKQMKIKK